MTATSTPPPVETEDIPGITRRHKFSDLYHERTNFQFIKHSRRWAILSGSFMVISILLVLTRGLTFGIEFKGGTEWQVKMANGHSAKVTEVRDVLKPLGFDDATVSVLKDAQGDSSARVEARVLQDPTETIQNALAAYAHTTAAAVQFQSQGAGGTWTLTAPDGFKATKEGVEAALKPTPITNPTVTVNGQTVTVSTPQVPPSPVQNVAAALAKYAGVPVTEVNINTVGPTWGHDVSRNALKGMIIVFFILALYLTIRFEYKMAATAIIAVIHDIIFTIGVYALFHFTVSPATVTAFLTILGFSLYDTVVVFDKISEYQRSLTATGRSTYGEMVNKSLNAVLMRSLSTSFVAIVPVLSLLIVGSLILGATALQDFALALAAGLFTGSYSSIFVAAPLLAWWKEKEPQYKALAERRRRVEMAAATATVAAPVVASADPSAPDDGLDKRPIGVAGPPAVTRAPIQPRARQQRGRKRH
jgi:preprotein translocase subunit SecF